MAAAGSMPTPPTLRKSHPIDQFHGKLAHAADPRGADLHLRRMVGSTRQGWAVYAAMMIIFLVSLAAMYVAEYHGNRW